VARHAEVAARLTGGAAAILIVVTGALGSGFSPLAIPFILYGLLPYGVLFLVGRSASNPWIIGGAGVAALTVELGVRAGVMLFPRGSTAAIALVFSPVLIGAVAMPLGALGGWLLGQVFARTPVVVRALVLVAAAVVLGLTFIAFARPEMFPTTVAARRRHLGAIGEPRVVSGGDRFARATISEVTAWHVTGEFDGRPGEELALVDHKGAQLVDAITLKPAGFVAFGGEPGRLWNWYSRLVRLGDTFVIAQTGGGFQTTQVMSLDNNLIWSFQPDPRLPPTALLPGDLDGNGEPEFYASTTHAVTRLNPRGEQVWSKSATLPHLVALAPRDANEPGWVVSTRSEVAVDILSPDGEALAALKWPGPVHGLINWPDARRLLVGDTTVKGVDADGATQFEIPIAEPLHLMQAVVWRRPAAAALLAVLAGGDRDLKRWRLRLYESPQAVVYDEVFDAPPRLLAAEHADGTSTVFVIADSTLSVLRAGG
jgi:hypothetical protein